MKNTLLLLLIFTSTFSFAQQEPKHIFESHLLNIKKVIFAPDGQIISDDDYLFSIQFLEDITGIKSDVTQTFEQIKKPSKKNLRAWKRWFKENKNNLYWDEKVNRIKVLSN